MNTTSREQPTKHYCHFHPKNESLVSCSKCLRYICPQCMTNTPVGMRCKDCADIRKSPVFDVSLYHYLKATITSVCIGIVSGLFWGVLSVISGPSLFFVPFLVGLGVGYAIGEGTSMATNRKRGTGLVIICVISSILAIMMKVLIDGLPHNIYDLLGIGACIFIAISRIR